MGRVEEHSLETMEAATQRMLQYSGSAGPVAPAILTNRPTQMRTRLKSFLLFLVAFELANVINPPPHRQEQKCGGTLSIVYVTF